MLQERRISMKRLLEKIKTAVIAILVFLMLILWTQNMKLRFAENTVSATSLQHLDSNFWIFTDSTNAHTETIADSSYISPVSITLVADSKAYSSTANCALTTRLWDNTLPLVKEVLSSSYVSALSSNEKWENELKKENFILVEFPESIPYMTLCAFENKTSSFPSGDIFSVKELLLYPSKNSTVTALCNDGNGQVYSLEYSENSSSPFIYDFNSNNLTAYTVNKDLVPSTLAVNYEESSLSPHHAILNAPPSLKQITVKNSISALFDAVYSSQNVTNFALISDPTIISLLENFNINPSTVGVYTDAYGRLIFINANTRLALDRKGNVEYSVSRDAEAQILTSSLLESERTLFSSFEQVAAVTEFLNLFRGIFIGADTELLLESVSHSQGKTEYVFGYYYNLCKVTNGSRPPEVKLVFDSKGLTEASITPLIITEVKEAEQNENTELLNGISENIILSLIENKSQFLHSVMPIYEYADYNTPTAPVWVTVTREVKE